jgi:hypothetical protein
MGHKINMDSECVICDKITDMFCDGCGVYVCETHSVKRDNVMQFYYLCPKCAKKNKRIVTIQKGEILRGLTTK